MARMQKSGWSAALLSFRFSEALSPRKHLPEKAPTAELTRINAGHRLFSVPLTRITSVPWCAVSSVGFLWGSVAVSPACGGSAGSQKPWLPRRPGPAQGIQDCILCSCRFFE
jgi:hypothetical protein